MTVESRVIAPSDFALQGGVTGLCDQWPSILSDVPCESDMPGSSDSGDLDDVERIWTAAAER